MNFDKLLGVVNDTSAPPENRVTDFGVQSIANVMQDILDKLSVLDCSINSMFDSNSIKHFRRRNGSVVIAARPGELEKRSGYPFSLKYTCDDYVIIEYDAVVNEVVQARTLRCDDSISNLVDSNGGIVIIEN